MLSGFRPGPPVRGAFFCLTAWCGRGGIGGPPPALFGPPPGPPPPPRWPLRGLGGMRRGPVVPPIRAGRPALFAGPSGPWRGLRAPGALLGPLRLSRPRAARRGGRSAPCGACRGLVLPPRSAPGRLALVSACRGGGSPPRGPGLAVSLAWCRPVLPTRRRVGALAPPPGGPSLLAPAPCPRGLRAAAAYRQPPLRQHVGHGIDRRHGTALVIQRSADPLDISILRHKVNCINLPRRVGAHVLGQAEGPGSPFNVLPDRLPCLMAPTW